MKKELIAVQRERHRLLDDLRNFSPTPPTSAPPAEVKVMDGGRQLDFRFEQGKCVAAPPTWTWLLRWSWGDVMKYFEAHRLRAVLTADEATA